LLETLLNLTWYVPIVERIIHRMSYVIVIVGSFPNYIAIELWDQMEKGMILAIAKTISDPSDDFQNNNWELFNK